MEAPPIRVDIRDGGQLTEDIYARMCATSRIPLDEVRSTPHGKVSTSTRWCRKDAGCADRLDVGNALHEWTSSTRCWRFDFQAEQADAAYPFRLIPRRANNFINSSGLQIAKLNRGKPYNPVFMHPEDIAELNSGGGGPGHDPLAARLHPQHPRCDDSLRRKVIATWHAFGGLVDEDEHSPRRAAIPASGRQRHRVRTRSPAYPAWATSP
jgi:hypothetical protein